MAEHQQSDRVIRKVRTTIERNRMFRPGEIVLVGVSGGPDSAALLHILHRFSAGLGLRLAVAHFDHGVRKGSAGDMKFVISLAGEYGLSVYAHRLRRKKAGARRLSEDAMRVFRYDFFFKTAKEIGARTIVLGHTADDQAETVLMRLLRGTGLEGLAGILPVRKFGNFILARPLLELWREDILSYLRLNRLKWRVDESNLREDFLRNKVRKRLLPVLKKYNPQIKMSLSRLAETAAVDFLFIEKNATGFIKRFVRRRGIGCVVPVRELRDLDESIRRCAIRLILSSLRQEYGKIGFDHWLELNNLIVERPLGSRTHLPGGIAVVRSKKNLEFIKR